MTITYNRRIPVLNAAGPVQRAEAASEGIRDWQGSSIKKKRRVGYLTTAKSVRQRRWRGDFGGKQQCEAFAKKERRRADRFVHGLEIWALNIAGRISAGSTRSSAPRTGFCSIFVGAIYAKRVHRGPVHRGRRRSFVLPGCLWISRVRWALVAASIRGSRCWSPSTPPSCCSPPINTSFGELLGRGSLPENGINFAFSSVDLSGASEILGHFFSALFRTLYLQWHFRSPESFSARKFYLKTAFLVPRYFSDNHSQRHFPPPLLSFIPHHQTTIKTTPTRAEAWFIARIRRNLWSSILLGTSSLRLVTVNPKFVSTLSSHGATPAPSEIRHGVNWQLSFIINTDSQRAPATL